ncbi:MAG: phytanoyl-CoA dioxygenase family protein [Actinomycetota bacterium]|nr:phytanoyl-CoA dioxygenase family protein [Acidimicrobiales bacterium]
MLSKNQISDYERDGFLVLRQQICEADIQRLERGLERNPPLDGTLYDATSLTYPEPGRYTLANNCLKDPDLSFLAEHSSIIPPVAELLGGEPRLTAFVIYDRTPGGSSIPGHNDYKRWRPVGSSMNWLFAITPFTDFDSKTGPLFVAPGSHHLQRITNSHERPLAVAPPNAPPPSAYIDPILKRGDLLLMNMHLWHRASGNSSEIHRIGAFNKYCSSDAPPATGYFLYDDDVHDALSPETKSLLGVHSDKQIKTTRLLLTRKREDTEILLCNDPYRQLILPGGEAIPETAIADWDQGNFVASLYDAIRSQLKIEVPWVSYIGDFMEAEGLCRVYAYDLNQLGFPVEYDNAVWKTTREIKAESTNLKWGYEPAALDLWLDPSITRGKALTQAQCRTNQYAF